MPAFLDLTGQTFNELSVTEYIKRAPRQGVWKCVCSCGKEVLASSNNIRSGHTKSCGCLKAKLASVRTDAYYDGIIGEKFGRLTVIAYKGTVNQKRVLTCRCACGTIKDITASYLLDGSTVSCGCYLNEVRKIAGAANKGRRWNKKDTVDETGNRYGRLTVLGRSSLQGSGALFNCICDCGTTKAILGYELRSGSQKSCGCTRYKQVK